MAQKAEAKSLPKVAAVALSAIVLPALILTIILISQAYIDYVLTEKRSLKGSAFQFS